MESEEPKPEQRDREEQGEIKRKVVPKPMSVFIRELKLESKRAIREVTQHSAHLLVRDVANHSNTFLKKCFLKSSLANNIFKIEKQFCFKSDQVLQFGLVINKHEEQILAIGDFNYLDSVAVIKLTKQTKKGQVLIGEVEVSYEQTPNTETKEDTCVDLRTDFLCNVYLLLEIDRVKGNLIESIQTEDKDTFYFLKCNLSSSCKSVVNFNKGSGQFLETDFKQMVTLREDVFESKGEKTLIVQFSTLTNGTQEKLIGFTKISLESVKNRFFKFDKTHQRFILDSDLAIIETEELENQDLAIETLDNRIVGMFHVKLSIGPFAQLNKLKTQSIQSQQSKPESHHTLTPTKTRLRIPISQSCPFKYQDTEDQYQYHNKSDLHNREFYINKFTNTPIHIPRVRQPAQPVLNLDNQTEGLDALLTQELNLESEYRSMERSSITYEEVERLSHRDLYFKERNPDLGMEGRLLMNLSMALQNVSELLKDGSCENERRGKVENRFTSPKNRFSHFKLEHLKNFILSVKKKLSEDSVERDLYCPLTNLFYFKHNQPDVWGDTSDRRKVFRFCLKQRWSVFESKQLVELLNIFRGPATLPDNLEVIRQLKENYLLSVYDTLVEVFFQLKQEAAFSSFLQQIRHSGEGVLQFLSDTLKPTDDLPIIKIVTDFCTEHVLILKNDHPEYQKKWNSGNLCIFMLLMEELLEFVRWNFPNEGDFKCLEANNHYMLRLKELVKSQANPFQKQVQSAVEVCENARKNEDDAPNQCLSHNGQNTRKPVGDCKRKWTPCSLDYFNKFPTPLKVKTLKVIKVLFCAVFNTLGLFKVSPRQASKPVSNKFVFHFQHLVQNKTRFLQNLEDSFKSDDLLLSKDLEKWRESDPVFIQSFVLIEFLILKQSLGQWGNPPSKRDLLQFYLDLDITLLTSTSSCKLKSLNIDEFESVQEADQPFEFATPTNHKQPTQRELKEYSLFQVAICEIEGTVLKELLNDDLFSVRFKFPSQTALVESALRMMGGNVVGLTLEAKYYFRKLPSDVHKQDLDISVMKYANKELVEIGKARVPLEFFADSQQPFYSSDSSLHSSDSEVFNIKKAMHFNDPCHAVFDSRFDILNSQDSVLGRVKIHFQKSTGQFNHRFNKHFEVKRNFPRKGHVILRISEWKFQRSISITFQRFWNDPMFDNQQDKAFKILFKLKLLKQNSVVELKEILVEESYFENQQQFQKLLLNFENKELKEWTDHLKVDLSTFVNFQDWKFVFEICADVFSQEVLICKSDFSFCKVFEVSSLQGQTQKLTFKNQHDIIADSKIDVLFCKVPLNLLQPKTRDVKMTINPSNQQRPNKKLTANIFMGMKITRIDGLNLQLYQSPINPQAISIQMEVHSKDLQTLAPNLFQFNQQTSSMDQDLIWKSELIQVKKSSNLMDGVHIQDAQMLVSGYFFCVDSFLKQYISLKVKLKILDKELRAVQCLVTTTEFPLKTSFQMVKLNRVRISQRVFIQKREDLTDDSHFDHLKKWFSQSSLPVFNCPLQFTTKISEDGISKDELIETIKPEFREMTLLETENMLGTVFNEKANSSAKDFFPEIVIQSLELVRLNDEYFPIEIIQELAKEFIYLDSENKGQIKTKSAQRIFQLYRNKFRVKHANIIDLYSNGSVFDYSLFCCLFQAFHSLPNKNMDLEVLANEPIEATPEIISMNKQLRLLQITVTRKWVKAIEESHKVRLPSLFLRAKLMQKEWVTSTKIYRAIEASFGNPRHFYLPNVDLSRNIVHPFLVLEMYMSQLDMSNLKDYSNDQLLFRETIHLNQLINHPTFFLKDQVILRSKLDDIDIPIDSAVELKPIENFFHEIQREESDSPELQRTLETLKELRLDSDNEQPFEDISVSKDLLMFMQEEVMHTNPPFLKDEMVSVSFNVSQKSNPFAKCLDRSDIQSHKKEDIIEDSHQRGLDSNENSRLVFRELELNVQKSPFDEIVEIQQMESEEIRRDDCHEIQLEFLTQPIDLQVEEDKKEDLPPIIPQFKGFEEDICPMNQEERIEAFQKIINISEDEQEDRNAKISLIFQKLSSEEVEMDKDQDEETEDFPNPDLKHSTPQVFDQPEEGPMDSNNDTTKSDCLSNQNSDISSSEDSFFEDDFFNSRNTKKSLLDSLPKGLFKAEELARLSKVIDMQTNK